MPGGVRSLFLATCATGFAAAATAQPDPSGIDFVTIGSPGNRAYDGPDPFDLVAGRGAVGYEYRIGRTELTTAQAVEFFNAALARSDPLPFVSQSWWAPPLFWGAVVDTAYGGPGTKYKIDPSDPNAAMRPVGGLSWRQAAVLCNWLTNEKATSTIAFMNGAYDVTTFTPTPAFPTWSDQPTHNPGATYWIPTLDEWMKAVHYDPLANGGAGRWWQQPNGTDTELIYGPPPSFGGDGTGMANGGFLLPGNAHYRIPLGSYPTVLTPWGLLDAAGGTHEWLETIRVVDEEMTRGIDGSPWGSGNPAADWSYSWGQVRPHIRSTSGGIRLASSVPSPVTCTIFVAWAIFLRRGRNPVRKSPSGPTPATRVAWAASIACLTGAAQAQPIFELLPIGLTDAEHTSAATGERHQEMLPQLTPGWIVGVSYQLGIAVNGSTVWIADPLTGETRAISPRDSEHTAPDGMRSAAVLYSFGPVAVYDSVLITAQRWVGPNQLGTSAWRYQPLTAISTRMGLWDAEHTNGASGDRSTTIRLRSAGDDVVGTSRRYVNGIARGESAWYARGGQPSRRVGLIDTVHTSPFGDRASTPTDINASGITIGTSALYHNAPMSPGQSAWRFDPLVNVTVRLGLLDAEHVDASGYHLSAARRVDDSGNVFGDSERYIAGQYKGVDAWVYEASSEDVVPVVLNDPEHTSASGVRSSRIAAVPAAGTLFGASPRFNGGWVGLGETAWRFDLGTRQVTRMGLVDATHTSSAGTRLSGLTHQLVDGRVIGWSRRYRQANTNGTTAWLFDPSTAEYRVLGFTDAVHVSPTTGFHDSRVYAVTAGGLVLGHSVRGSGGPTTLWRYDTISHTLTQTGVLNAEHAEPSGYATGAWDHARLTRAFGSTSRLASLGGGLTRWYLEYQTGAVLSPGIFDSRHRLPSGVTNTWFDTEFSGNLSVGQSSRYNGTLEVGQTAFVYDSAADVSYPIVMSEAANGYAYSDLGFVTASGAALGVYRDLQASASEQFRLFYRNNTSVRPLDQVVAGGFESSGFRVAQYEHGPTEFWPLSETVYFGEMGRADRPGNHGFMLRVLPTCNADVNCDFALDGFDVETQERAVGGDLADYCLGDPDYNRDQALDGFDVEAVEQVVGGGTCP